MLRPDLHVPTRHSQDSPASVPAVVPHCQISVAVFAHEDSLR